MIYPNQKTKVFQTTGSNSNILGEEATILSISITTDGQGSIFCPSVPFYFYSFGTGSTTLNTQWNDLALTCPSLSSWKLSGTVADIYVITYVPDELTPTQLIESYASTTSPVNNGLENSQLLTNFLIIVIMIMMLSSFIIHRFVKNKNKIYDY